MCTLIAKVTKNTVTILDGPCCMSVEDIAVLCPKISRKNGWKEYGVDTYPQRQKTVRISLDDDVLSRHPVAPIAVFSYRKGLLHFRSVDQIRIVRSYIADTLRSPRKYPGHERYLMTLPKPFLGSHDRPKVLKRMDKLLKPLPSAEGPSADDARYAVKDGFGVRQAVRSKRSQSRKRSRS
ncbi:MAG: hypothetical protein WCN95_04650 [bacterium]